MAQPDALERYERTAAQDLLRVMEAARPSHNIYAPPHFYAKVMQRVEQRRAYRGRFAAWLPLLPPVWVPALSVGLLVSLGLNLWLGLGTWVNHAAGPPQIAHTLLDRFERDTRVQARAFQLGTTSAADLNMLVVTHSAVDTQSNTLGFTDQTPRTLPFLVGTLYVEALASMRSGSLEAAVQRMRIIDTALSMTPLPHVLGQYLRALQPLLATASPPPEVFAALLPLFEPLYDDYTRNRGLEAMTLFRLGVWLENMLLATATNDPAVPRQGDTAKAFHQAMQHLRAPTAVQERLAQLSALLAQPAMTAKDVTQMLALVQKIQRLLIG
jgi:hypothetical protein